jgi:hypothetical protein
MANQATYDDANLILRLYELRREEKLRAARAWFTANFHASSLDEMNQIAPAGSQENANVRMVLSYWDMAASLVTSGVLNQDLFFQSSGELLFAWERFRGILPAFRDIFKNPSMFQNLETVGNAYIEYFKTKGPDAFPGFQDMVKRRATASK